MLHGFRTGLTRYGAEELSSPVRRFWCRPGHASRRFEIGKRSADPWSLIGTVPSTEAHLPEDACFDQLMGKNLATALVERLLHHAHVVLTDGEPVRLADATAGKGVVPLAR
ncbi:MAG: hypothetical protein ACYCTL_13700 [Acidimicrobiales bacterium]